MRYWAIRIYDEVACPPTHEQLASPIASPCGDRWSGSAAHRIQLMHEQLEERIPSTNAGIRSRTMRARARKPRLPAPPERVLGQHVARDRSLTAVLGFSQPLGNAGDLAARHREMVARSRPEASIADLLNGVLEMSKIESGYVSLNKSEFEFRGVLAEVESMLRLSAASKG